MLTQRYGMGVYGSVKSNVIKRTFRDQINNKNDRKIQQRHFEAVLTSISSLKI